MTGQFDSSDKPDTTSLDGWQSVLSAPFDRDLELAIIDLTGTHALVFPCRRIVGGWAKSKSDDRVLVVPTHWRAWKDV